MGGAVISAPGPPPATRTLEERVLSLEKRVGFLMRAWQEVAYERSERRAEMTEVLGEIQGVNMEILAELRSRPPPAPLPPP